MTAWNKGIQSESIKSYRAVYGGFAGANPKRLHIIRAERALGKPLPPKAVVHHADGTKDDESPLVICENQEYHFLLHRRMRILRAGGNPNTDSICKDCGPRPVSHFSPQGKWPYMYCRACRNQRNAARKVQ